MELNLDYINLKITIQFKKDTILPRFPATTFRGGIGAIFRKSYCLNQERDRCPGCSFIEDCIFSYIFKTAISKEAEIRNKSQLVSPPYIVKVPFTKNKKKYKKREVLEIEMTILGQAIDYLSYFVFAVRELGEQGVGRERAPFDILYISHGDEIIYKEGNLKKEINPKIYSAGVEDGFPVDNSNSTDNSEAKKAVLNFTTPVRIETGGKLVTEDFSFELLLRNIMRRLDSILFFHMGYKLKLAFGELVEKAKEVKKTKEELDFYDNIRYSGHQNKKIWMGGFTGTLEYRGELSPFIPLLELGEIIHVGKKCVYGMGGYDLFLNSN